ncbi:MAG TPA: hypothetical protein VFF06_31750 [Polyangia bacterium]|nr:hypothetical protein [Polyangia bacterium]
MRRFALALAAAWLGCGGAPGIMRGGGVNCGGRACPTGLVCCADFSASPTSYACAAACAGMTVTVSCDGTEDCDPNGARYCCAEVARFAAPPGRTSCAQSGAFQCRSSCQDTGAIAGCSGGGTSRLCRTNGDCEGDLGFASCCGRASEAWSSCVDDATRASLLAAGGQCA